MRTYSKFIWTVAWVALFLAYACQESPSIQVIHITDAHVDYNSAGWDSFVKSGVTNSADIVLDSGDFCDTLTPETQYQFSRLPRIYAYGNHEVNEGCTDQKQLEQENPRIHHVKNWTVITLPWWRDNERENIAWLRLALLREKAPIIILTHEPLVFDQFDRSAIADMVNQSEKVRLVFSGHIHRDFVSVYGNAVHISTPPLFIGGAYHVISVHDSRLKIELMNANNQPLYTQLLYLPPTDET